MSDETIHIAVDSVVPVAGHDRAILEMYADPGGRFRPEPSCPWLPLHKRPKWATSSIVTADEMNDCPGPPLCHSEVEDIVEETIRTVLADVAERMKRRAEALRAASPQAADALFLVANELEPDVDRRTVPSSDEVGIRPIDDEGSGRDAEVG